MSIISIPAPTPETFEPITCYRTIEAIPIAGQTIGEWQQKCFSGMPTTSELTVRIDWWPSPAMRKMIVAANENLKVTTEFGEVLATLKVTGGDNYLTVIADGDSLLLRYPWDILRINEMLVGEISEDNWQGTVRERVAVDGVLHLGAGSVVLPGVYIEGKIIIGENCKIGPNCYLRGNTAIGNNCHIGQAVEIKNSLIMDRVAIGHLSYLGDSIVCSDANFGAGTITANLRHDGKNHRSAANGLLIDTGRRKFGAIIGDHVHTGIHTSLYPGRKLWPNTSTKPGEAVSCDLK